jgi:DNA-binding transcriptional ArsR family regulator
VPPTAHDPTVLRAIAHPARTRILGELDASGPMRAADIARELGIPANRASFHLRQLAKYGLIEEDPAAARDRRDRVWRLSPGAELDVEMDRVEAVPGGLAASKVFRSSAAAWGRHVVDQAMSDDRTPGTFRSTSEHSIKLTKDEARELQVELSAVAERWAERTRGQEPDRRTYLLYTVLQPYPSLESGEA